MEGRLGKKITLNISELNIVKEKVVKYPGTIEDYLMEKGFTEVLFGERGTLPSRDSIIFTCCLTCYRGSGKYLRMRSYILSNAHTWFSG